MKTWKQDNIVIMKMELCMEYLYTVLSTLAKILAVDEQMEPQI